MLSGHTHLLLDVNSSQHLQQIVFSVLKELLHLHYGLQLVELLYLIIAKINIESQLTSTVSTHTHAPHQQPAQGVLSCDQLL